MAVPTGAVAWAQPLDPSDRADYVVQLGALLTGGEIIETATVTLLPEAVALGLTLLQDAQHGPSIADDTNLEMWFEIDDELRENTAFRSGADLPIEISIVTSATPERRFQRTMVLKVIHL